MSDLTAGLRELADSRPELDEAEAMYEGTVGEVIASRKLRKALGDTSGKFRLNYARAIVGARLDKLEVSSVTCDVPAATELLTDLWDRLGMADETHDTHEAFGEFGEAIVIVWPTAAQGNRFTEVAVSYNDPRTARAIYSADDLRTPKYIIKAWLINNPDGDGKLTRVNLYFPDRLERYISVSELKTSGTGKGYDDSDFTEFVDDAGTMIDEDGEVVEYPGTWPIPNPYPGVLPGFHFRTGRPHGRPLHRDAYGPQNAINKLIATQMGNVDFTGLPQRYVLEDDANTGGVAEVAADFEDDADDIPLTGTIDDDDAGSDAKLTSEPGGLWRLRNAKGTGQYEAADPAVFLEPWDKFVQGMSVTTKTPMSAFRIGGELPSGAARRADDAPLNGHVADLQRRAGATWANVYEYVVLLLTGAEVKVTVTWAPLETFDDKDTWDVATTQLAAGVPLRRVLTERGYTDEQCVTWGIPAYNELSHSEKVSNVANLGAAVRDLGTASALGTITPEQVAAVMASLTQEKGAE